jgi:hypothetical protein
MFKNLRFPKIKQICPDSILRQLADVKPILPRLKINTEIYEILTKNCRNLRMKLSNNLRIKRILRIL